VRLEREPPRLVGGELRGRVAYIDRFGNCITNLTSADLERAFPGAEPRTLAVRLGAVWVQGLSAAYAGAALGALLAVMGSSGRLEVAQYGSAASSRLGVVVGDPVTVRVREGSAPPPAAAPTHWR
jgi:S-adenosylmethionine hydrolase